MTEKKSKQQSANSLEFKSLIKKGIMTNTLPESLVGDNQGGEIVIPKSAQTRSEVPKGE